MNNNPNIEEKMLREVKPTLLRLLKIVWSQCWRLTLVLIPLYFICKMYRFPLFDYESQMPFRHIHDPLMIQLKCILEEYFIESIGFFLILGIAYKDFIFDFNPKLNRETKDYWESLARISWAYTWRAILFEYSVTILFTLVPLHISPTSMEVTRAIMSIVARIIIFKLIVNKEYGNTRVSLLGNGPTPGQ
jgi:hypothetical protein